MQYLLNQPQTKAQLIDWLKQPAGDRGDQLRPFYHSVTKYTSPLCIKTSEPVLYHVDAVMSALATSSTIEELPDDVIMFFPNYDTLHAAFVIAKEKWSIDQAVEYIGTTYSKPSLFTAISAKDKAALTKVGNCVLYPYFHWVPVKVSTDNYSVTSGHFPFLGSRKIPVATADVSGLPPLTNYETILKKVLVNNTTAKPNTAALTKYIRNQGELTKKEVNDLLTYTIWPLEVKKDFWKNYGLDYRASPALYAHRIDSMALLDLWQSIEDIKEPEQLLDLFLTFTSAGLLYAFSLFGNKEIKDIREMTKTSTAWEQIEAEGISNSGWKVGQVQLASKGKSPALRKWANFIIATGMAKSPFKSGLMYIVTTPKALASGAYAHSPAFPYTNQQQDTITSEEDEAI